jgi:hypothetical protein
MGELVRFNGGTTVKDDDRIEVLEAWEVSKVSNVPE